MINAEGVCESCERVYEKDMAGHECPSDDCPSHHEEKNTNSRIKVIITEREAPVILSTRFGEWQPDRGACVDGIALSDRLSDKFSDGKFTGDTWLGDDGDPRNFMCHQGTTSVAAMKGDGDLLVGILTEVDLPYVEASDLTERSEDIRSGNALLPQSVFADVIQRYAKKMDELQDAFPYSDLFLAHGDVTCNGRLSLCAFTALSGQEVMHYSSPYPEGGEIEALDMMLNSSR